MNKELLEQFAEFLEKQDLLSKLTEHEKLHGYGYSDIHVVAAIGDLPEPNVTAIADHLNLTKGAVSKITKRLQKAGVIDAYQRAENQQKIFFRLTKDGRFLYEEHDKRHRLWLERDNAFLENYPTEKRQEILTFMTEFNQYLETKIKDLGGK